MARLNKNSEVYYIRKAVGFQPLNISKVYLIDDNCNEFIATVKGLFCLMGYYIPTDVKILDYEEYTAEKWDDMTRYIEYERAVIV